MSKLTQARDTVEIAAGAALITLPVKGATTIWQGSLVALDQDGYAVPGEKTEGLKAAGRAEETVANGGADGEKSVTVARGVFYWENSESDPVSGAHALGPCYIEDDQTVSAKADGASCAGMVLAVTETGVAVETGFGYTGPASEAV